MARKEALRKKSETMAEGEEEEVPRRMKRFYRKGEQGAGEGQSDVFSKPLPSAREEREFEPVPESEKEEQAETIYREQEAEGKEIDWGKKRKEELEKMKASLTTQKVQEFRERHHRLPEGSEEEEIAQTVFEQLQKEEKRLREEEKEKRAQARKIGEQKMEGRVSGFRRRQEKQLPRAGMGVEAAEARPGQGETEIKGSEVLDLLKEEPERKQAKKEKAEEGEGEEELEELEEVGGEGEEEAEGGTETKSCPNCGKQAKGTIYCPECGAEFCNNCAPPRSIAGKLKYKCPKCGYEFSKQG